MRLTDDFKRILFVAWIVLVLVAFGYVLVTRGLALAIITAVVAMMLNSLKNDAYLKRDEGAVLSVVSWAGYLAAAFIYNNWPEGWSQILFWALLAVAVALDAFALIMGYLNDTTGLMPLDQKRSEQVHPDNIVRSGDLAKIGLSMPFAAVILRITEVAQGLGACLLIEFCYTGKLWFLTQIIKWVGPSMLEITDLISNGIRNIIH